MIYNCAMLIDFHTHFFPDHIAKEAMNKLAEAASVTYHGDGTMNGLLAFMKQDKVDISVNLPVSTKPEQVHGINRKMIELNAKQKDIISFGTMHPDFTDFENEVAFLSSNGIKGIKMHSEYQAFCPEEKRLFKFYEACAKHNIAVLFHAGLDIGYPTVRCKPQGIVELLKVKGLKVILAHMGSFRLWDDVEKHLVGKDVYFDLAYCNEMDNTQLKRIIENHGSDKVLFASDFPWERAEVMRRKVESLGLAQNDKDNIYFKTASKLLGL